jgi:hypothetical protein
MAFEKHGVGAGIVHEHQPAPPGIGRDLANLGLEGLISQHSVEIERK